MSQTQFESVVKKWGDLTITLETGTEEHDPLARDYTVCVDVSGMAGKNLRDSEIDAYGERYAQLLKKNLETQGKLPGAEITNYNIDGSFVYVDIELPKLEGDDPRDSDEIVRANREQVKAAFEAAHKAVVAEIGVPEQHGVDGKPLEGTFVGGQPVEGTFAGRAGGGSRKSSGRNLRRG